jgi:hypothetical protein
MADPAVKAPPPVSAARSVLYCLMASAPAGLYEAMYPARQGDPREASLATGTELRGSLTMLAGRGSEILGPLALPVRT